MKSFQSVGVGAKVKLRYPTQKESHAVIMVQWAGRRYCFQVAQKVRGVASGSPKLHSSMAENGSMASVALFLEKEELEELYNSSAMDSSFTLPPGTSCFAA